jgi:methylenetetrahydrofolate dehydrogenase (NADP+)/methenyltetrahydrofolate cyclohydrolase/formyltetrahydrofolate synthetase
MKEKAAAEVDIKYTHIQLPATAKVEEVIKEVQHLNADEEVSGILVQLPLGDHVDPDGERQVTEAISPDKDVDG